MELLYLLLLLDSILPHAAVTALAEYIMLYADMYRGGDQSVQSAMTIESRYTQARAFLWYSVAKQTSLS